MQPVLAAGSSSSLIAVPGKTSAKRQIPVNSASFWNLKPEQVAAEDAFFHQYFAQVGRPALEAAKAKKAKQQQQKQGGGEEGGSGDDGEATDEEEIWDALVNSRPEVQGDEDDGGGDDDFNMEDYDDSDASLGDDDDDEAPGGAELGSDFGSDLPSGDDDGFEGIFGDSEEEEGDSDGEAGSSDDKQGAAVSGEGKRKGRLSRKEMRKLPMFASADDYAEMLAADDDLDE